MWTSVRARVCVCVRECVCVCVWVCARTCLVWNTIDLPASSNVVFSIRQSFYHELSHPSATPRLHWETNTCTSTGLALMTLPVSYCVILLKRHTCRVCRAVHQVAIKIAFLVPTDHTILTCARTSKEPIRPLFAWTQVSLFNMSTHMAFMIKTQHYVVPFPSKSTASLRHCSSYAQVHLRVTFYPPLWTRLSTESGVGNMMITAY